MAQQHHHFHHHHLCQPQFSSRLSILSCYPIYVCAGSCLPLAPPPPRVGRVEGMRDQPQVQLLGFSSPFPRQTCCFQPSFGGFGENECFKKKRSTQTIPINHQSAIAPSTTPESQTGPGTVRHQPHTSTSFTRSSREIVCNAFRTSIPAGMRMVFVRADKLAPATCATQNSRLRCNGQFSAKIQSEKQRGNNTI